MKATHNKNGWITAAVAWVSFTLIGCPPQLQKKEFDLTIIVADRLGVNKSEKLPQRVIDLCLPIEGCGTFLLVPKPKLRPLGQDESTAMSLEAKVSGGFSGDPNNPNLITRTIQRTLEETEIGEMFTVHNDHDMRSVFEMELEAARSEAVILYLPGGSHEKTIKGFKVYNTVDSVRLAIIEEICNKKSTSSVVLFYGAPTAKRIPPPPVTHTGETPSPENADRDYQEFIQWRDAHTHTPSDISKQLEALEERHGHDYRFTLERVRVSIYGFHDHPLAFKFLRVSAEKAIKNGRAKELLDILKDQESDRVKGFWKLATHPHDWNPIIEALQEENTNDLYHSHKN